MKKDYTAEELRKMLKEDLIIALDQRNKLKYDEKYEDAILVETNIDSIGGYLVAAERDRISGSSYSSLITEEILDKIGWSIEEAIEIAYDNVLRNTSITSMEYEIYEMCRENIAEEGQSGLYVLTNYKKLYGANSILNTDIINKFMEIHNTRKLVCIPSSVHEWILIPHLEDVGSGDTDEEKVSNIIKVVNEMLVNEDEILGDEPIIIER